MTEAILQLRAQGLAKPHCVVVHGLFAEAAHATLQSVAESVVSTDTVPHPSNAIGVLGLLAKTHEPARRGRAIGFSGPTMMWMRTHIE